MFVACLGDKLVGMGNDTQDKDLPTLTQVSRTYSGKIGFLNAREKHEIIWQDNSQDREVTWTGITRNAGIMVHPRFESSSAQVSPHSSPLESTDLVQSHASP